MVKTVHFVLYIFYHSGEKKAKIPTKMWRLILFPLPVGCGLAAAPAQGQSWPTQHPGHIPAGGKAGGVTGGQPSSFLIT